MTLERKRGGLRPPPTRNTQRYSHVSLVSDLEKILKDAKAKQKWASSSGKSIKTQSKFISKDQVHKSDIKEISNSPVLALEKSNLDLYVQSSVDSIKVVTQVQVGVEPLQNFSEYDGEIVLGSNESKIHIASPSSKSINSEPSLLIEEKSKISSLVQVRSYFEVLPLLKKNCRKFLKLPLFLTELS